MKTIDLNCVVPLAHMKAVWGAVLAQASDASAEDAAVWHRTLRKLGYSPSYGFMVAEYRHLVAKATEVK